MSKNLLIIESPNKINTIKKYLENDNFEILATVGHVRDIPSSNKTAFDPATYEPNWKVVKKPNNKQPIIDEIKEKAKKADKIYLATDPDREGEAIAWHVYDILNKTEQEKCVRITFNEITKDAINEALKNERDIQMPWVYSQFARRILDRVIGYDLSKFVRSKYHGSSAGRVQSVVLKFIHDREKEIEKFKPVSWWTLDVELENNESIILREANKKSKDIIQSDDDEKGTGVDFKNEKAALEIKESLGKEYKVYLIDPPKAIRKSPKEPYKTSTLQQDAANKLGWSLSKITKVSQDLYEGVEIDKESIALISYPRTDSVRMAPSFEEKAKKFIIKTYGEEYVYQGIKKAKETDAKIQDAHECIRIIDPYLIPSKLSTKISKDHFKLYQLIWQRTIASLMSQSITESTIIRFSNNDNKFYTYNRDIIFDGYKKVYNDEDLSMHKVKSKKYAVDQKYEAKDVKVTKHTTEPPPRLNPASLVKILDESGIGRPSTYRMMADIGLSRGYIEHKNKAYYMLPIGNSVIEGLIQHFNNIINQDFTKDMEDRLDKIASSDEKWNEWMKEFIPSLRKQIGKLDKTVKAVGAKEVGRKCPECNSELVYRFSKVAKKQFIGCGNFPKCKYAEFPGLEQLEEKCPDCGHNLVLRTSKRGRKFIGCSNYPKCTFIKDAKK